MKTYLSKSTQYLLFIVLTLFIAPGVMGQQEAQQLPKAKQTSLGLYVTVEEGDKVEDPLSLYKGQRLRNDWKNSGEPWTYKTDPKKIMLKTETAEKV